MASTRLGYMAVGFQTDSNTAVKPANFIRFKDGDLILDQEIIKNNPIQNNRWLDMNAVEGKQTIEGSYNFDFDFNESVFLFKSGFGEISSVDVSSETDGSVYTHTINVANCGLPYMTLEQGKGAIGCSGDTYNQGVSIERSFGVMIDTLTISGSDQIVNIATDMKAHGMFQKSNLISDASAGASVDIAIASVEGLTTDDTVNIYDITPQSETDAIAAISVANNTIQIATLDNSYTIANKAKVELVAQTPSYSTEAETASMAHVRFQFGADLTAAASASYANIENWEISFENQLEERYGSLRSSPSVIAPKGAMMTFTFTKYFENVEERDKYLDLEEEACIMTLSKNKIISATDTNQTKYESKIKMSKLILTSYEVPTGTDDLYAANVEGSCFYSDDDGKAVELEVTNGKAGTFYS